LNGLNGSDGFSEIGEFRRVTSAGFDYEIMKITKAETLVLIRPIR